eukprot:Skav236336  [mRNA]  locus=scaffold97:309625:313327:- [translate_table: standard]
MLSNRIKELLEHMKDVKAMRCSSNLEALERQFLYISCAAIRLHVNEWVFQGDNVAAGGDIDVSRPTLDFLCLGSWPGTIGTTFRRAASSCLAKSWEFYGSTVQLKVAAEHAAAKLMCNVSTFGEDPAFNRQKECWCAADRAQTPPSSRVALVCPSCPSPSSAVDSSDV